MMRVVEEFASMLLTIGVAYFFAWVNGESLPVWGVFLAAAIGSNVVKRQRIERRIFTADENITHGDDTKIHIRL